MTLRINDEAPNFNAETTEGTVNFHDWIGEGRHALLLATCDPQKRRSAGASARPGGLGTLRRCPYRSGDETPELLRADSTNPSRTF